MAACSSFVTGTGYTYIKYSVHKVRCIFYQVTTHHLKTLSKSVISELDLMEIIKSGTNFIYPRTSLHNLYM